LIYTDFGKDKELKIKSDIYTDLEKLRLDMVAAIRVDKNRTAITYAYLMPPSPKEKFGGSASATEEFKDLDQVDIDFSEFITELEGELSYVTEKTKQVGKTSAILVGVYDKSSHDPESSMLELKELARTANLNILDTIIQYRTPDPKTLLGTGKLEQVVLHCLKLGAELIVFDCELRPGQWRAIINETELKVIDRSMLILDIFAQRANSSEGRLQVELAQLKYNLPRLVESDAGLSRLSGGIGGRGPGETKLELGRRRIRDRISMLEKKITKIGEQRDLRRKQRTAKELPVVAILGYTNVGKSTLFNFLTNSDVVAENKLFATLDPAHRRLRIPSKKDLSQNELVILTDTVGFIRNLPKELRAAFKATLDELKEAQVLIHVLDASDRLIADRKNSVDEILTELELTSVPQIIVLNKIDRVPPLELDGIVTEFQGVPISAANGVGVEVLVGEISNYLLNLKKITKDLQQASYDTY